MFTSLARVYSNRYVLFFFQEHLTLPLTSYGQSWSNWWDDTEDDGYAQIEVNVNHALKLARIATRALLSENKRGTIQIVASIAGYAGTFSAP